MRAITIILVALLAVSATADDYIKSCGNLRIGTKEGATDVMLDGQPTDHYKKYKYTKDENDVEVQTDINESVLYVHGIKLEKELDVQVDVGRQKLLKVTKSVTTEKTDKTSFKIKLSYE